MNSQQTRSQRSVVIATALVAILAQSVSWRTALADLPNRSTDLQNPRDAALQTIVEERLKLDPRVDAANISVAATNGAVVLSGMVDNLLDKEHAREDAEKVGGVTSVKEKLALKKVVRSDSDIQQEITRSLTINPSVNAGDIKVAVQNSAVSLTGTVNAPEAKKQADQTVKNTEGVMRVTNNIRVSQRPGTPQNINQQ